MQSLDFVSVLIHIPSTKTHSGCEMCSSPAAQFSSECCICIEKLAFKMPASSPLQDGAVSNLVTGLQRCLEEAVERVHQTPCS